MDEPDGLAGQAAGDELVAEFVVDVPVIAGRADVAEDQLEASPDGGILAAGCRVGVVAVGSPQVGDPFGRCLDLAGFGHEHAEQAQVEGGLAAVHADLEHVVFFGQHLAFADRVGALAEGGHDVELDVGRLGDDGFRGALAVGGPRRQGGDGELEVLAGLDVGGDVPAAEHLRDVGELGEAGLLPEAVAALGGHLDLGDGLAEGGGPAVEVADAGGFQQVGPQVVLHDPGLGDAVGDRGGGGEGDDPGAVAAAQVADLHVQVGGAHRPVDGRVGDVGRGAEVLVAVRLVDEQVVDAGGLEGDAGVLDRIQLGLEPFLGAQQGALQALDGQPVALLGGLDEVAHPLELGVEVGVLGLGAHRDALERRTGHDDRVPVAGGAARDELAAPAGLEVFALGDQDLGLGVELEELAAELLEHVVGHDDGGLAGQVQPTQFHRAHGHLGRLARADLVEQADGGLVDDAGDGRDLMRAGLEAHGQAGQGQLGVVVGAEHDVVEQPVVGLGQLPGPGGVLPGPFGEPFG